MINLNNRGISLIEITVGAALSGLLIIAFSLFMNMSIKSQRGFEESVASITSDLVGSALISRDLSAAGASFDLLNVNDDSAANFFDLTPELNCTNCARRLKITPDNNKSIVFVTDGIRRFEGALPITPTLFYDVSSPATSTVSGTMDFSAAKLMTTLMGLPPTSPNPNPVGPALPLFSLTQNMQALLFYSPVRMRPAGSLAPARAVTFVGVMNNGIVNSANFEGMVIQRHPATLALINSPDTFFRNMPSVAGNGAFAFVKAVIPVRYTMDSYSVKNVTMGRLLRGAFDGSSFPNCSGVKLPVGCQVVAMGLQSVEFQRASTSTSVIQYQFTGNLTQFNREIIKTSH